MSSFQSSLSNSQVEDVSKQATKTTVVSNKLAWRIEKFERLMKLFKNGQSLISKKFSSPYASCVAWELHVYPNGKREEDAGYVSFFLRQVGLQGDYEPIITEFQIYGLNESNNRISICRDIKDFSHQQGRGKFQVPREKLLVALHVDGSISLHCDLEFLRSGSFFDVKDEEETSTKDDQFSVCAANRDILENELFPDCKIQVGSKTFSAHRCMLAQHSHVFHSMFSQSSTLEAQKGTIVINDTLPEAIRAMLEYIYTATVDHDLMEEFAQDILAVADKYAVLPLKDRCEKNMMSKITNENAGALAVLADIYSASCLKKACVRFIATNHKDVSSTNGWQDLKRNRSEFVSDLLESVLCDKISDLADGQDSIVGCELKKRRI